MLKMLIWRVSLQKLEPMTIHLPQIPRSYLTLQKAVVAEKQRRAAKEEVQYLTESQLQAIVEQDPGSDIRDYEDLQTGIGTSSG